MRGQMVEVLPAKADDLILLFRTHMVEIELTLLTYTPNKCNAYIQDNS